MATVKGKDVIGLRVIAVVDGSILETVDDIAYNPVTQRIEALFVNNGGMFSPAKAIHMDDVRNIGENAVIVQDASAVKPVKKLGDAVRSISGSKKYLVKTNVLTVEGRELGKVTDIYFDSRSGTVESFEVSQGSLMTLSEGKKSIKPSDIVTIGADATIVSAYTEAKLATQGEEGGLKGVLNDAKEKAAEVAASAKESVQDVSEAAKRKSLQLKDQIAEKSVEARDVMRDNVDDAKDFSREKAAEARIKARELNGDVRDKSAELSEAVRQKSVDLKASASESSGDAKLKANTLAESAKRKADELAVVAAAKATETKGKVNELAVEAKRKGRHAKQEIEGRAAYPGAASHTQSGQVVEKSKKEYSDENEAIIVEKTRILK